MRKRLILLTLTLYCLILSSALPLKTTFAQEPVTCPGFMQSRLVVGQTGRVTPGDANNVRSEPSRQSASVGSIPGEGVFRVLDGPVCADNLAWWQVDYNGLTGWTVEGADGEYWLEPYAACQSAFKLGEQAEVMSEDRSDVYSQPDSSMANPIATLGAGQLVTLIDGPICDARATWVKVNADGLEGWMRESGMEYCDSPWCGSDLHAPYLRVPLTAREVLSPEEAARHLEAERTSITLPDGAITPSNVGELRALSYVGDGAILGFVWSPDSQSLAVMGSVDVRIYDPLRLNTPPHILGGFHGIPTQAAYRPDGQLLVTGDSNGVVQIWDSDSLQPLITLQREGDIEAITFSDDGTYLAIGTRDTVGMWQIAEQPSQTAPPTLMNEFTVGGSELRFIPGSDRLIAFGSSGIYVLNPADATLLPLDNTTESPPYRGVATWDIDPSGQSLIAIVETPWGGDATPFTYIYSRVGWNLDTGEALEFTNYRLAENVPSIPGITLRFNPRTGDRLINLGHEVQILHKDSGYVTSLTVPEVTTMDISPDGELMALGTASDTVQLFINGQYLDVLYGVTGGVQTVTFSPNGQYVAAFGKDNAIRVWLSDQRTRLGTVELGRLSIPAINASGTRLASVTELWDVETGTILNALHPPDEGWTNGIVFQGETPIVEYYDDGVVYLQDMLTGAAITSFVPLVQDSPFGYRLSPDFSSMAEVDEDSDPTAVTVYMREVGTNREIGRLERYFYDVLPLVISPNNRLLALQGPSFGPEPTTLMVWDITTRDLLMETSWEGFSFTLGLTNTAVAWTELVEVTEQGQTAPKLMVNYTDFADNRMWSSPLGEQDALVQFVFNPDEALLVSSGFSGRIYIWDVETGEQLASIDAHVDRVLWLAFSADGRRLFSYGAEGIVKVWGVE